MKDKRIYGMFGPKIKAMRMEHGLKQRQLAELLILHNSSIINFCAAKMQIIV